MKILVLNKDWMERTVIQQVLQSNGHEIISAESSDTAMQLIQEETYASLSQIAPALISMKRNSSSVYARPNLPTIFTFY